MWISFPQRLWKSDVCKYIEVDDVESVDKFSTIFVDKWHSSIFQQIAVDNFSGTLAQRGKNLPGTEGEEVAEVGERWTDVFLGYGVIHKNCG
jgi:hypothetical protein